MKAPCMRSVSRGETGDSEEFCAKRAYFQVVVTFNGHRYLIDLCGEHKAEHDDVAARLRMARREANAKARRRFENDHALPIPGKGGKS